MNDPVESVQKWNKSSTPTLKCIESQKKNGFFFKKTLMDVKGSLIVKYNFLIFYIQAYSTEL